MREYRNLELSQSPPPDLAIECDLTSKTVIQAYEAIGVPEVWIYTQNQLKIYLYSGESYTESEQSRVFPKLRMTEMLPALIQTAYQIGTRQMLAQLKTQFS